MPSPIEDQLADYAEWLDAECPAIDRDDVVLARRHESVRRPVSGSTRRWPVPAAAAAIVAAAVIGLVVVTGLDRSGSRPTATAPESTAPPPTAAVPSTTAPTSKPPDVGQDTPDGLASYSIVARVGYTPAEEADLQTAAAL